jgi:hypothetical protein
MRIKSPSLSDEEGALYVPKVGKHRPAIAPTAQVFYIEKKKGK